MTRILASIIVVAFAVPCVTLSAQAEEGVVRISDRSDSGVDGGHVQMGFKKFINPCIEDCAPVCGSECGEYCKGRCYNGGCKLGLFGKSLCKGHGHGYCGHCNGRGCSLCGGKGLCQCGLCGWLTNWVTNKHGLGGAYSYVYAVDPNYFDQRDGKVYAANGFGLPVSVPLAPNVRHTYNYGWGVPSSRLTPVSRLRANPYVSGLVGEMQQ
ncbi:hypothetical protein [Stratiformator vulcanicus]|uniref:Stigma-specific protein, Stig1 n=1 Tax=Stratiformator vulcanicus TaxID=2527980 RepID=A0A517R6U5_9PLAN|nr:hypothetical protein [Stratiformator vulcanicus]QDT39614.1 hypothetical protein Pan189_40230 [Stratiformator vulcanicus]